MPLAAYADWVVDEPGTLRLDAAWGDADGQRAVARAGEQAAVGSLHEAEALGYRVALALKLALQQAQPSTPASSPASPQAPTGATVGGATTLANKD